MAWKARPETAQQRCRVHKTASVPDKRPKSVPPSAKELIHEIYLAPNEKKARENWGKFHPQNLKYLEHRCHELQKVVSDAD